jgi:16S rRNA (uracil1498-N3)-methyltransferase
VADVGRKEAQIRLGSPRSSPALRSLTLLTAAPKGDRFRWLVEKATELGVTRLIPISTERSVVSPGQSKLHKLEQTVIAACKQSGRNWLLPIDELRTLPEALQKLPATEQLLAAHPKGQDLAEWTSNPECGCTVIVGPEGGFTDEECTLLLSANARVVSLGETILRTETAAIALAAWCQLTHGE